MSCFELLSFRGAVENFGDEVPLTESEVYAQQVEVRRRRTKVAFYIAMGILMAIFLIGVSIGAVIGAEETQKKKEESDDPSPELRKSIPTTVLPEVQAHVSVTVPPNDTCVDRPYGGQLAETLGETRPTATDNWDKGTFVNLDYRFHVNTSIHTLEISTGNLAGTYELWIGLFVKENDTDCEFKLKAKYKIESVERNKYQVINVEDLNIWAESGEYFGFMWTGKSQVAYSTRQSKNVMSFCYAKEVVEENGVLPGLLGSDEGFIKRTYQIRPHGCELKTHPVEVDVIPPVPYTNMEYHLIIRHPGPGRVVVELENSNTNFDFKGECGEETTTDHKGILCHFMILAANDDTVEDVFGVYIRDIKQLEKTYMTSITVKFQN